MNLAGGLFRVQEIRLALTGRQEDAAALCATDHLGDPEIAKKLGVSRSTLNRWRETPAFTARVAELRDEIRAAVRHHGIAVVENRVARLNQTRDDLLAVIAARRVDETMTGAGHHTGLLVRSYKQIGQGEGATMLEEYRIDAALLRELRDLEKQAAIELGQWQEKTEITQRGAIVVTSITAVQPTAKPAPDDA